MRKTVIPALVTMVLFATLAAVGVAPQSAADAYPATSATVLVNCPFDGNADDISGNVHDGAVSGATLTTDRFGNPNRAYLFDGVDDFIQLAGTIDLRNRSFSISIWARNDESDDWGYILAQGDGEGSPPDNLSLIAGFIPGDKVRFGFFRNDLDTPLINDPAWHNWHMTYDATTGDRRIYRDALLVASDQTSPNAYQGIDDMFLGAAERGGGMSLHFAGALDDFCLFDGVVAPLPHNLECTAFCPCASGGFLLADVTTTTNGWETHALSGMGGAITGSFQFRNDCVADPQPARCRVYGCVSGDTVTVCLAWVDTGTDPDNSAHWRDVTIDGATRLTAVGGIDQAGCARIDQSSCPEAWGLVGYCDCRGVTTIKFRLPTEVEQRTWSQIKAGIGSRQ